MRHAAAAIGVEHRGFGVGVPEKRRCLARMRRVARDIAIAGVGLGMLVAPRLGRLAERNDEDEGDGND